MEYKIRKQKNEIEIEVSLTATDWGKEIDGAYAATAGKYTVQGFRKGKAPRKVIEQSYGEGIFTDEALRRVFPRVYSEILKEHPEIKPIDYPYIKSFEPTADGGMKIVATVDTEPEFVLGKYTGLEIKKAKHLVNDKQVDEHLTQQATTRARQVAADKTHKIKVGDITVIDFAGSIDGVAFEGGTGKNHELEIGSGSFIDNFEDQLVGAKIGDKIDVKVKFPDQYHAPSLAGKPAVFAVTINNVLLKQVPAVDDNFAREVSEFDNLVDYKKSVKANLEKQAEAQAEQDNKNALLKTIVDSTKLELPEKMVDAHLENIMTDLSYRLSYQGIDLETYAQYIGTTVEKIRADQRKNAEMSAKSRLVFDAIMDKEKIEVSKEDIAAEVKRIADANGKKEKDYTSNAQQMDYIAQNLRLDKLIKFLTGNNKFV